MIAAGPAMDSKISFDRNVSHCGPRLIGSNQLARVLEQGRDK